MTKIFTDTVEKFDNHQQIKPEVQTVNTLLEKMDKQDLDYVKAFITRIDGSDKYIFDKPIDVQGGTFKIGTADTQKIGFWGVTPVDQPDTVSDASTSGTAGAGTVTVATVDANFTSCKNAINAIIDRLQEAGIIA